LHQTIGRLATNSDEVLQRVTRIEERMVSIEKAEEKKASRAGAIWGSVSSAIVAFLVMVAQQLYFRDAGK